MGWIEGVVISFMAAFRFCFGSQLFLSLVEVTSAMGRGMPRPYITFSP